MKGITEHASALARLEVELAQFEIKRSISALGLGAGLAAAALLVALYAVGFLFATIAAGLATFLAVWLSLLIVTVFLLLVVGILALPGEALVQARRHAAVPSRRSPRQSRRRRC